MARKLIVEIVGDSKSYERSLGRSEKATQGFARTLKSSGASASAFAKKAAFAGTAAAAGLAVLGVKSVQAASNLNEQLNKSNVVFGNSASAIQAWSKTTANSLGLSQRAALEAAGGFGQMLQTAGLGEGVSADFSKRLVGLASDIASFNNIDPDEALLKLKSGLAGEAEPLRAVGVLLSENRVKQEAYRTGIAKTGSVLSEGQKVQARYSLILKDSAKQQGDFARTSNSFANAQRRVKSILENSAAAIGRAFLPIVAKATSAFANFLPTIERALGRVSAVVGPALSAAVAQVAPVFRTLVTTIQQRAGELRRIFLSVVEPIKTNVLPILRDMADIVAGFWSRVVGVFGENSERIKTILSNLGETLKAVWTIARPTIVFLFQKVLPVAINVSIRVLEQLSKIVKLLSQVFVRTVSIIIKAIDVFLGGLTKLSDAASHLPFVGDKFDGVSDKINAARDELHDFTSDLDALNGKQVNVVLNVITPDKRPSRGGGALEPPGTTPRRTTTTTTTPGTTDKGETNAQRTARLQKLADKATTAFQNTIDSLTLRFDKDVAAGRFKAAEAVLGEIRKTILARIKIVGRTTELARQLWDNSETMRQTVKDANEATAEAVKAAQFQALGLTATGEKKLPGGKQLLNRATGMLDWIKGTSLDTKRNRAQLRRIVSFLKANFKTAGREVRQAIIDMLNDVKGAGTDAPKGPLTKTAGLNTKRIIEGLGLSGDEARAIRSRLSGFNTAGRALAGSGSRSSAGQFVDDRPIVVHTHTTINVDGQKMATNVTKHQQKGARRNPRQKRGPNKHHTA